MGFDFGQINGKRFGKNSWVEDENAWNIADTPATPSLQPLPLPQQSTWDKVKAFDFGGLAKSINPKQVISNLGQGLSHGLAQTGSAKMDRYMADAFASKPGLLQPNFQAKQASQQKQDEFLKENPVNSIAGTIGEQIPQIPLWMAGEGAINLAGKGLTKAFPSLLPFAEKAGSKIPGIVKGGLKDATTYGAVVAPVDSIRNGDNLSQFLDREKQLPGVFLGGAGLRGAGKLGGMAGKGFKDAISVNPYSRGNGLGVPLKPLGTSLPPVEPAPVRTPSVSAQEPIQAPTMNERFEVKPDQRVQGTEIPNDPNPIPNAETGKPFKATLYRGEVNNRRDPAKGTFYTQDKEYAGLYAKTADVGGKPGKVVANTVISNNPLVSLSKRTLLEEWSKLGDETATKLLKAKDIDFGNAIVERYIAKKARELGHDSIVLKNMMEVVQLDRPLRDKLTPVASTIPEAPIAPTITPPQHNIGEPKAVNERRFAQNVRDSNVAPENVKQNTLDNPLNYEPITNKETLEKANLEVATDAVKARQKFNAPSKGISADDVALGESLIVKAIKDGDTVGANELIADLAEKLTQAGQAVQAAKIFKRLTPEGMLLYAQRTVNTVNKNLIERLGVKAPKVELTPEDSKFIIDTMTRVQKLADGREKDVAMAQVKKLISEKMPATLANKVAALQRISLLLNPKTMVRNTLGNTVFGAIDNVANTVATPIDMLASKLRKTPRTTTLPSLTGQLKSMAQGAKITAQDAKLGIDTYNTKTQYEFSGTRNFNNPILHKLDRATIVGLKMGDTPFHKAAFDDSIRQQLKLSGESKPTLKMEQQAQKTADQRTYQDVNALTDAFKMIQKSLNKISSAFHLGNEDFGLGNLVVPFVKTPANILKRALEYSPIGLTDAIKEATKLRNGKFDQKVFVDSISRSTTGSALIMVGYDLAKRGIITGSGNKDKDVAAFERGLGKNDYAYKYGDNLYTYDWMQPGSMAIAIGADVYIKGKDRKQAENVIIDAAKSGGETLFKQSLLQGVTRFMSGYNPMDSIAKTVINSPTQFIPTIAKQISQTQDPTQRTTYSPDMLGTAGNMLKARIPGMTKSLEPKINTSGETQQTFQGRNTISNIFLNPGSSTTYKPNEVQKGILDLYEKTGDVTIFPRVAPKSLTYKGESFKLTPKEMTSYQQTLGRVTETRMAPILTDKKTDNAKKVEELQSAITKASEDAKMELLQKRGIEYKK